MKTLQSNFEMVGYLSIHKATRRQFDIFLAQIAGVNQNNKDEVQFSQRKFDFYWKMLEHHHLSEDHGLFPMLAGIDPEFAAAQATLTADHQALDRLEVRLQEDLREVLENRHPDLPRIYWQQFYALAQDFNSLINGHLDREEALVIPAVTRHFTVAQQLAAEVGIVNQMGPDHLARAVPWMYEVLDPAERSLHFSRLPMQYKTSLDRWQQDYRQLFAPVVRTGQPD